MAANGAKSKLVQTNSEGSNEESKKKTIYQTSNSKRDNCIRNHARNGHIPASKTNSYNSNTTSSKSHHSHKAGAKYAIANGHVVNYGSIKSLPANVLQEKRTRPRQGHNTVTGYNHNKRAAYSGSRHHGKHIHHSPATLRRLETKESAISFFDIELQKTEKFQYRPGEEVCGCIHMDVRRSVEIRFLELICVGEGTVTLQKHKEGPPLQQKEIYLQKRTYVIGTGDARWTSVLTPGHYVSSFKVKLPRTIPSSLSFEHRHSGFKFEISYMLKARICDDIGSSSIRGSTSSLNNLVKVLLCKKQTFNVQRPFDLHQIPNALIPVLHEEEILLSCANNNIAYFTLSLDRAVFLAGDDIRLQLTAHLPQTQKIKDITCHLKQNINLSAIKEKQTFVLTQLTRKDPEETEKSGESYFEMTIPTPTHLLTSFLSGCKTIEVTYTLKVVLKLSPGGGRVQFAIPVSIGPSADPIYAEKNASKKIVPVFNRPVRFPCFSPSKPEMKRLSSADQTSRSSQSINVVTKYSNSALGQCILCCVAGSAEID